jgi:tetratricopeptide (TPR) repeat protein
MRVILALVLCFAPLTKADNVVQWRECLAESGRLYAAGNFSEAERALATAVRDAEQFPALDSRLPGTLHALAFLYQEQGKYPEAIASYTRAIHLWEKIGPSQHKALLLSIDNLIGVYIETRDYRQAKKLLDVRLPEMEQSTKWEDQGAVLNLKALLAMFERRFPEAESLYTQSLDLWQEHKNEKNVAIVLISLSELYVATNRYQDALDAELRALAIFESMDATMRPFVAQCLHGAAFSLAKLNRLPEAENYYERALAITREVYGTDHFFASQVLLHYSELLRQMKRKREAETMANEARDIISRSPPARGAVDAFELKPAWP